MATLEIEVWVGTNLVRSTTRQTMKVDEEDWAAMNDTERDQQVFDFITQNSMIEWGWKAKK